MDEFIIKTTNKMNSSECTSKLVLLARYFGNAKTAASANFSDLDLTGFTLKYKEKSVDYGIVEKEVRVLFSGVVRDEAAVTR